MAGTSSSSGSVQTRARELSEEINQNQRNSTNPQEKTLWHIVSEQNTLIQKMAQEYDDKFERFSKNV